MTGFFKGREKYFTHIPGPKGVDETQQRDCIFWQFACNSEIAKKFKSLKFNLSWGQVQTVKYNYKISEKVMMTCVGEEEKDLHQQLCQVSIWPISATSLPAG